MGKRANKTHNSKYKVIIEEYKREKKPIIANPLPINMYPNAILIKMFCSEKFSFLKIMFFILDPSK